jgi:sphingomyelin phosphodiesterase
MWLLMSIVATLANGPLKNSVECTACRLTIQGLQTDMMKPSRWTKETEIAVDVCVAGGEYTRGVCQGAVDENVGIVIDSLVKRAFDPDYLCKQMGYCSGPEYVEENFTAWVADVMASKPPGPPPTPTNRASYLFAQMSDIHVDMYYKPGTQNNCNMPVCCRNGTGSTGVFGDYNCDLPIPTFQFALQQLQGLNPEFIIITGDMPPHDIWNQSDMYNMGYQSIVSSLLKEYFPNTQVYGIYGNHACFPVNQFSYEVDAEKWLLDGFAENWGYWLDAEAIASLKQRGTYAMLHPGTNLRMVALNTQACNDQNFYLWVNSTDPGGQVQWLWETLLAAEKNGEVVYMFGHYYLADDGCLKYWSFHLNALIDRFEATIAGMFFGHSHSDSFHVNRGVYSDAPTRVQFVTPSVTTYTDKNPSFRVYHGDSDSKLVVDYDQYRLNLPKANASPTSTPVWDLAYSFKSQYGVSDMSPASLFALAQQIGSQQSLAITYLTNHETGVNPPTSCDAACLHSLPCDISYGVGQQVDDCTAPPTPSWQNDLQDILFPPWVYKQN